MAGVGEDGEQVLSGDVKGWAVASEERSGQVPDVPTLTEAGFDLVVSNWRGLMTHPGIGDQALTDLTDLVTRAHDTPEWRDVLAKQGWDDEFQTGSDYGRFLADEEQRVSQILRDIGLV